MGIKQLTDKRGAVLVLVAVVLVALIGIAALALDVGRLYVARQRAQNVCDASAIAGVWELALHRSDSVSLAESEATRVADECAEGNNDLVAQWCVLTPDSTDEGLEVTFPSGSVTDDAGRAIPVEDGDAVRTRGDVNVEFGFARVLGFDAKRVPAAATAIVEPSKQLTSNLFAPLVVSDRTVFGYGGQPGLSFGEQVTLKVTSWQEGFLGSGNFGAVDLPGDKPGASDFRDRLSGNKPPTTMIADPSTWIDTETGNMIGPAYQGLSSRLAKETDPRFKNDATAWNNWGEAYDYTTMMFPFTWRIMIVPIVEDPLEPVPGRKEVEVVGYAGFFVERAEKKGDITGRFIQGIVAGDTVRWVFPAGDSLEPPDLMLAVRIVS